MSAARLAFASATGPLVVTVALPEAAAVASALFPDDRTDDPGGEPALMLAREGAGYALRTPEGAWRAPDLGTLLVRLELSLAEELLRRTGLPGLHAGGVVLAGGAVLFPGDGGVGKSSLTAALALRGAPVLGDDVVLLDARGLAHPFRRLLKLEDPARTLLGIPPAAGPLAAVWPDATFCRPSDLGSRWAAPAPVRAVVLPRRAAGAHAEMVALRPAAVLPGLLTGLVLSDRVGAGTFDAVASALADAQCWELRYATTPEGADALLAALA